MFSVLCSISIHTYAVMGVNTALIQAALLSRARVYTIVPARIEARIDMIKGNFKLELLPVQGVNKIASALYVLFCPFKATKNQQTLNFFLKCFCLFSKSVETLAVARNVEELAAAKFTPIIPPEVAAQRSSKAWSSKISSMASSLTGEMVRLMH